MRDEPSAIPNVATSVAAFIGRTPRGPVDSAIELSSFADYTLTFGALDRDSSVSYQVKAFFDNGGTQAVVVRLYRAPSQGGEPPSGISQLKFAAAAATASPDATPLLELSAANPGAWARELSASIDTQGITATLAAELGVAQADLFNLSVSCGDVQERFTFVTLMGEGGDRLDKVLASQSRLVRLRDTSYLQRPAPPAGASARADEGGLDSAPLQIVDYLGDASAMTGLQALRVGSWTILSIPPDDTSDPKGGDTPVAVYEVAAQLCAESNAMLIIDPPMSWSDAFAQGKLEDISLDVLGTYTVAQARASAVYFPRVRIADPLAEGALRLVVPSGYIAAVWASMDTTAGVWKAPAGLDAPLGGIIELEFVLDDSQNGVLNPQAINVLRCFHVGGNVVWGARTLHGASQLADTFQYIHIQRLFDFIHSSLSQGTAWAAFQPNGPTLWSSLSTQVTAFMTGLFEQGAFAGTSASQAFFVKCDATTTTPADQAAGIVYVQIGFAPIYPAEFVILLISQATMA